MTQLANYFKCVFVFSVAFIITNAAKSQTVNGCTFLKGNIVELGIAPNGAFGTPENAPTGYHPRATPYSPSLYNPITAIQVTRPNSLGFVADYGKDGWNVGTPAFFGDYFLPGTSQEGFSVQIDGQKSDAWTNNYRTFGSTGFIGTLMGSNVSYTSNSNESISVWQGNQGNLSISQTVLLKNSKSYFTVTVKLKNTGTDTLRNVYYLRTLDPDNEVTVTPTGNFATKNKIVYQLPNTQYKTLVTATGLTYTNAYLGLGTKDCRAKCFYLRSTLFANGKLDDIYNETFSGGDYGYKDSSTSDAGIGLIFNIGKIAPGDSTSVAYAYILGEEDLDEAFSETAAGFLYNGNYYASGSVIVQPAGTVLPIKVVNGNYSNWTWLPPTNLNTTIGADVNATVSSSPITYSVTGSGVSSGGISGCGSRNQIQITISPYPVLSPPTFTSPVYYCVNDLATPLEASGVGTIRWYTEATGGTFSTIAPTPSTSTTGSTFWYVSRELAGVESARMPIEVIVKSTPVPNLGPDRGYCLSASSITLNPGVFDDYTWQDGSKNPNYTTNTPGKYWVTVQNGLGCIAVDTVEITAILKTPQNFLPKDTAICKGNELEIRVDSFETYQWDNGSISNKILAKEFKDYILKVVDKNNCTGVDTFTLYNGNCLPFMIPNSFTPNGDLKNDVFKPLNMGSVLNYKMEVYERWGNLVFISKAANKGWDGTKNGVKLPVGVYVYNISFNTSNGFVQKLTGTVVLLR